MNTGNRKKYWCTCSASLPFFTPGLLMYSWIKWGFMCELLTGSNGPGRGKKQSVDVRETLRSRKGEQG